MVDEPRTKRGVALHLAYKLKELYYLENRTYHC